MNCRKSLILFILFIGSFPLLAADYFVNRQGNALNDGLSRDHAFASVAAGVTAMKAGDTLTIGPGEYSESVLRKDLGSDDVNTVIQAEIKGSVILRGDVELSAKAFHPVPGYRHVYMATFDREIQGVSEVASLSQLNLAQEVGELEFRRGSCYYDLQKKLLYVSTIDNRSIQEHHFTVSVVKGSGLLLINPRRVIVEGIATTGFQSATMQPQSPTKSTHWGIYLRSARHCVVRQCVAWFNGGGIAIDSDGRDAVNDECGWNLIEHCQAYANGSKFTQEGGNILGFASNHDEIRHCEAYLGSPNGIRLYGAGIRGPAIMRHNLAWGNSYADIFIKGGKADELGLAENCIALGFMHVKNLRHCLIGNASQYNRNPKEDTVIGLYSPFKSPITSAAYRDANFADPLNFDFRLQGDSKLRGTGPEGSDRGAYAFELRVYYVKSDGNDTNDGLSMKQAWKTLSHALPKIRPGDTLYLDQGTYDLPENHTLKHEAATPVTIRGRGRGAVVLHGNMQLTACQGIAFENLNFSGSISISQCQDVSFHNCRFHLSDLPIQASHTKDLRFSHCEFTGFSVAALKLRESTGAQLTGNFFNTLEAPAINLDKPEAVSYSDYNGYGSGAKVWHLDGDHLDLASVQQWQDGYSSVHEVRHDVIDSVPVLRHASMLASGGPIGSGLGVYHRFRQQAVDVSVPEVYSVSDSTADLEWYTPAPAITTLAWGETPDTPQQTTLNRGASDVPDGFNSLSLTGLKSGTTYYYRVIEVAPASQQVGQYMQPTRPEHPIRQFTTAEHPRTGRQLFVASDGDDSRNGLDRSQAWRSLQHAASNAKAGDTVHIAGGIYSGTVRVRSSGSPEHPITFRALPGEQVILDGENRSIRVAFSVLGKEYIQFDGLRFRDFAGGGWVSPMDLRYSKHLIVERCLFNGYGRGTPGVQLRADHCEDVIVRNCLITRGFQGISLAQNKKISLQNNVFLNNLICPITNSGGGPGDIVMRKNIFIDSIPSKLQVHLFEFGGFNQYVIEDNAYHLRVPDEQRKALFFYGGGAPSYRLSLAEYEQRTGQANLIVEDPQFAIPKDKAPAFSGDWIPRKDLDFPDLFTLHPELQKRGIGLLPEAFLQVESR